MKEQSGTLARISKWIRERPVFGFYVLAFAITWLGWVPQALHSRGLFPFGGPLLYLFGAGPMVAAFVVLRVLRGGEGDGGLFGPLLRWRVGAGWYGVAPFGYAAIWLAAIGIGGDPRTELEEVGPLLALVPVLLVYLLQTVPEEVAWRGFALPRLQSCHSARISSLIVGILWAMWHLPLLLTEGSVMSTYPLRPLRHRPVHPVHLALQQHRGRRPSSDHLPCRVQHVRQLRCGRSGRGPSTGRRRRGRVRAGPPFPQGRARR